MIFFWRKFRVKHIPTFDCEAQGGDTNEDTEATNESPPQDEEEDDPNEVVVVEEEAEVTKEALKSSEADANNGDGGGMGTGGKIILSLLALSVVGAVVVYREKIAYMLSGQKHTSVNLQPSTNLTYG